MLIYEISIILINCSSALVGTWTRDLSLTKGVLYRWATRAILKWAGLDQSRLPAAQWFWSVQNKFRRPFCGCQIISRECCNLSSVHFLQMILLLWDNFIDWQSIYNKGQLAPFFVKSYLISGLVDEYRIKTNLFAISPNHAIKVFQQKYPKAEDIYVIQNLFKKWNAYYFY